MEAIKVVEITHVDSLWLKVGFGVIAILIEAFGNTLLASMYLYEKFGQDPQKRTLINIMISNLFLFQIVCNMVTLPLLTIRLTFGPLEINMATFLLAYIIFSGFNGMFVWVEVQLFRYLYIAKWSRMALVTEEFCAKVLQMMNFLLAFAIVAARYFLGELSNNVHLEFLAGFQATDEKKHFHTTVFLHTTALPIGIGAAITVASLILIRYKKFSNRDLVLPFSQNEGRNKSILGGLGVFIGTLIVICIFAGYASMSMWGRKIGMIVYSFMGLFSLYVLPSLIAPGLFFLSKPKIVRPTLELPKDLFQ